MMSSWFLVDACKLSSHYGETRVHSSIVKVKGRTHNMLGEVCVCVDTHRAREGVCVCGHEVCDTALTCVSLCLHCKQIWSFSVTLLMG